MFKNKIIFSLLTLIVILTIFFFFFNREDLRSGSNPRNIKFIISTNQSEYLKGEYVWINIKLINGSDQSAYLKDFFAVGAGLELEIKNSHGQIIKPPAISFLNIPGHDSVLFAINDTFETVENLDWFNLNPHEFTNEYKIRAKYNNFISNEIEFKIIEPEGSEREILNFIRKYDKERIFQKENGLLLDQKATELLNQYPNSKYSPILYEQLLRMMLANYPDTNSFNQNFEKYMNRYGDSYGSNIIIPIYSARLEINGFNNYQIKSKLEDLNTKYENSPILKNTIDRFIKRNIDFEKYWFKYD